MKKKYITPDMEMVNIQISQHMLTGSLDKGTGGKSANESDASFWYDEEDGEDW